jgi:hypothetical protein
MGVVLAVFVYVGLNLHFNVIGAALKTVLSLLVLAGLLALLMRAGSKDNPNTE